MTLYPGDYLDEITIEHIDAWQGAGVFKYRGNECFLLNSDVPEITLTPGLIIKQVVCVKYDNNFRRYRCLPPHSYQRLAETLFDSFRPSCAVVKAHKHAWSTRWDQAVLNREDVTCQPLDMECHIPNRRWVLLKHEKWEMPVPACSQFDAFDGEYRFFPSVMQNVHGSSTRNFISPAYKAYSRCMKPGSTVLLGRLDFESGSDTPGTPLPVEIYVHPFISPEKFHFGVWKHVFAWDNNQEKACWANRLAHKGNDPVPESSEVKQIFEKCAINSFNTSCQNCNIERYSRVTDQIERWLEFYCEEAVVFFTACTTESVKRTVFTAERVLDGIFHVQFAMDLTISGNKKNENARECRIKSLRGVYRGTLFANDRKAVIHINPVTLFFTSGHLSVDLGRKNILGILSNVQKSD